MNRFERSGSPPLRGDDSRVETIIETLNQETKQLTQPLINQIIDEYGKDPYLILIACLLSLRVKDLTTIHVCRDLFNKVKTPLQMLDLNRRDLEKIIFKTGFYRNKAKVLHEVSKDLLERFGGKVPRTEEELLTIKGIGRKTANLVLGMAFDVPAICVDTHVQRISNRLGLISTQTVEQTEETLKRVLRKDQWIVWNKLLVIWGQNICVPISPKCSKCAVKRWCRRVGVTRSR